MKSKAKIVQIQEHKKVMVNSHTYGKHERAARGSIKPALLNAVLKENTKRTSLLNPITSELHNLLKQYAGFFKENMLWQKLLGRMHKSKANTIEELFASFAGLDLNAKYSLNRFGNIPVLKTTINPKKLHINLYDSGVPIIKSKDSGFCYDVIIFFFNNKGKPRGDVMQSSKWFKVNESIGKIEFAFDMPNKTAFYLVCLRMHTGANEEATNLLSSQGMMIMKTGKVK